MKELSIEEKAQRYDEALERAKGVIEQNPLMEYLKKGIEYILPELKESKDERIRKDIVEAVELHKDFTQVRKERIYAWLEKQGEISPSEDELEALRIAAYEPYKNWSEKLQSLYMKLSHCAQGEQEPIKEIVHPQPIKELNEESVTDLADYIEKLGKAYELNLPNRRYDIYAFAKDIIKHLQINILQNSWSEEDENHVSSILSTIECCKAQFPNAQAVVEAYNADINWFKSLKARVQPKIELTQLDKNILEAAIAFVEQNDHFNCWSGVDKHTVLSALYSLKPQNTWKPSDEQMEVLDIALKAGIQLGTWEEKALRELKEQLKKLREE